MSKDLKTEFEASYKVLGPTDSKRDGYMVDKRKDGDPVMTGRIELETPMGTLIAEVAGNQDFPGLYLSLRRPDDPDRWEKTVALLECPDNDVVMLHLWNSEDDGDGPDESRVVDRRPEAVPVSEEKK